MSLSCECDSDWYPEPGDWLWSNSPEGYTELPFKKRRRCCSCKTMIDTGALAVEHQRAKIPDSDIEVRIYGEDGQIPIASDWMCEKCGDLYFSLVELGYCISPRADQHELVKEYAAMHDSATIRGK